MTEDQSELLSWTVRIVTAQLGNNMLPLDEVAPLIGTVHSTLAKIVGTARPDAPTPAVPIKKSVTRDYIVCLEDGRRLKTLKRHLSSAYNMTPEEYRARWGLPPDYPMVAPNYARKRSALAKQIGLGRRG